MGKNSKYYKDLRKSKLAKINEMKCQLPLYTHSYIEKCVLKKQINTAYAYTQDIVIFFEFLKAKNPLCSDIKVSEIPFSVIEQLNSEDIDEFQAYMKADDESSPHMVGARTLARKMATVRGFFGYMKEKGYLPEDPTEKAEKNEKFEEPAIKRLSKDEAKKLLAVVEAAQHTVDLNSARERFVAKRDYAIVTLLLNTGIRVSECIGIDLRDLDFDNQQVKIVRKGGKETKIYMGKDVCAVLLDYIEHERPKLITDSNEEALFLSLRKKRIAARSIEAMLDKYRIEAGIADNVSAHTLRRTYGTRLYNTSGDIYMVANVLGHKDINTTAKHYAAVDEDRKKKASEIKLYD
jgi:site-specific recombinase XerD